MMIKKHTTMKQDYLQQVKTFYARHRRLPTYTEMLTLFGFASRNAVHWVVKKWIDAGMVEKIGNRLSPTAEFFSLPILGIIQAGAPTMNDQYSADSVSLDQYLVPNPGFTYLLRVQGDSMVDAGIHQGDLVIVDKKREPKNGDIVAAFVDNEWTVKYLEKNKNQLYLKSGNINYPPIYPTKSLTIGGVVIKVIKEYY
jgi:SOS regulatory protein LexA